jgi:hypothetical protein
LKQSNKLTNELISVNNKNNKTIYDNFVGTTLVLPEDQQDQINTLISQGKIDEIKSMENIELQEIDGSYVINLKKHKIDGFSTMATPTYKTNAYTVYRDWPILTKTFITSRTVWSDALYSFGKSDCYVYAKVYKKRLNFQEVKFDFKTFFIDNSFTAIGAYLGVGSTVVEIVVNTAGIYWAVIGGVKAIQEMCDMARDAQYSYFGEKSGYVFDKTTYNTDVKVYTNMGYGTIDGGLDPSGRWTWIDSPPSPAYDVQDQFILDKAVYNYNASIWLGGGYVVGYYPE